MMMKFLFALSALMFASPINPLQYLSGVKGFSEENFFKIDIYLKNDWRDFEQLPEVNVKVNAENFNLHVMNACLFYASNKLRQSKKVLLFNNSEALRNAALMHTNEMVVKNFYSHLNPKNTELRSPDRRMKLFGITNVLMAENIHSLPFSNGEITYLQLADEVMADFYKSEGHRQNLMNKNFNYTGCGAMPEYNAKQKSYFLKVTQCFAKL